MVCRPRRLAAPFGGWAFLAGVALKAIYLAARLVVGAEPVLVSATGTLGSVALIVAAGCLLVRVAPRARRNLLWRVRAQLILSYVFIGVIPALLIVAFFIVSGLVLFLNVASYLVTNGFDNVRNEAIYVARLTATEIQRGPGPGAAEAILSQRESALASIYPGRPSPSCRPEAGNPAWAVRRPPCAPAACRTSSQPSAKWCLSPAAGAASRPPAVTPVAVGPWEHGAPPEGAADVDQLRRLWRHRRRAAPAAAGGHRQPQRPRRGDRARRRPARCQRPAYAVDRRHPEERTRSTSTCATRQASRWATSASSSRMDCGRRSPGRGGTARPSATAAPATTAGAR